MPPTFSIRRPETGRFSVGPPRASGGGVTVSAVTAGVIGSPAASPSNEVQAVASIGHLLQDRDRLKTAVVQSFLKAAGGVDSLDIQGLQLFRNDFSSTNKVPIQAFGDLVTEYLCFDFDGSGRLDVNEVYKFVKFHLLSYRKRFDTTDGHVDVPFKSLREAGYIEKRVLGEGAQAKVKLATHVSGKECCVKCMDKQKTSASGIQDLIEEFEAMQFLACEKVAQATELFQDNQFYYMVGEPYLGGDFTTLKARATQHGVVVNDQYYRNVFQQCFEGLKFMHGQAMLHCDIKEPNLMLKTPNYHQPDVVIIDFGVAKAMAEPPGGLPRGTPGYMPPETLDTGKWFPRGDMFSMGVCMIQMVLDKIPPLGARTNVTPGGIFIEGLVTIEDICQATRTREPPFHLMPASMQKLTRLLRELLAKRMTWRPTPSQVLKDPWFSSVNPEHVVKGRHARATVGITKSFLANMDSTDASPASVALLKLQAMLGVADSS